jgi:2-polyprenyl-6-methoxyphenol hydroxylase-like FAD-dependent oxidoreductase
MVSPIGGQGMNSGWLDCREILNIFKENRHDSKVKDIEPMTFNSYSEKQKKVVIKVARRAEINMALGRKRSIPALRNLFIQGVLRSPLKNKIAELFTMRGLEHWWI